MGAAGESVERYLEEAWIPRLHPRDRLGKFRKSLRAFQPKAKSPESSVGQGFNASKAERIAAQVYDMPQEDLDRLDNSELDAVQRAINAAPILTSHFSQTVRQKIAQARQAEPERKAQDRGDIEGAANARIRRMSDEEIASLSDGELYRLMGRWSGERKTFGRARALAAPYAGHPEASKGPRVDVAQDLSQFQRLNREAVRRRKKNAKVFGATRTAIA